MDNTPNHRQLRKPSIRAQGGDDRRVILNRADSTDDASEAIDDTVILQERLKESLMQNLLTGKVHVQRWECLLGSGASHG